MSIIDRLFNRKPSNTAGICKQRLSIIVDGGGSSELSIELEEKIKKTVYEFYQEKGILDKLDIEEFSYELTDDGLLAISIPLPDK